MKIAWLKPLVGRPGPFATVYLDATPAAEAGEQALESRWRSIRRELASQSVPEPLIEKIAEHALKPAWAPKPRGRIIIADVHEVLVDRVVSSPPAIDTVSCGPVPALAPAVRAADEAVRLLLVTIDRSGADLTLVNADRDRKSWTIDGDDDVINKVNSGGTGQSRGENRAEDSWERNARKVASGLERAVAESAPELVVLTGDVRAVALVRDRLGRAAQDLAVEVPGDSRGPGAHPEPFLHRLAEAVDAYRERRRGRTVDAFREAMGRTDGAVTSLEDVVTVLSRGQVDELLLDESIASGLDEGDETKRLWVGPDPMQIAERRSQVEDLGAQRVEDLPAAIALIRAALGQDAGITVVSEDELSLVDGVGATLRWSDGSTPREFAATMSGDHLRLH